MREALAAVAAVSAGNYAAIAVGVLTSIALARLLGSEEFGRLALLLMVSQVAVTLTSTWSLTALVRYGAQEHAVHGRLGIALWARMALVLPGLALALGVLWAARAPLATYVDVPESGILALALHAVGLVATQTVGAALQASGRLAIFGLGLLMEKIATLAVLVLIASALNVDAAAALAASAVGAMAAAAAGLAILVRAGAHRPVRLDVQTLREQWRFSVPLLGGNWAGFFGSHWLDYIVIRRFLSLSELGLYALAFQIAGMVQQLSINVATVALPRYSQMVIRGDYDGVRQAFARIVPVWLLSFSVVLALMLVAAETIVPLVFGPSFAGAVASLRILLVASVAVAVFHAVTPALTAHGVVWPITWAVVVAVSANLVLDILLIPTYGIVGSAIASLVSYLLSATIVLLVARRTLSIGSPAYGVFLIAVGAMYLCVQFLQGTALYAGSALVLIASLLAAATWLRSVRASRAAAGAS